MKKTLPEDVLMAIEMNPPRTPYGLKILAQMLIVQKRFMEDYLEDIKNIVFITQG